MIDDDELSDDDVTRLRGRLVALRDKLTALLEGLDEGSKPVDLDEPIGRLSRMDAMQQQSMTRANRQRAKVRRRQVIAALKSIDEDDGGYGYCNKCDEPIPLARLEVYPESPLCIPCQETLEGGGRKRRR